MSGPPAPEKAALETIKGDLTSYYKHRVEEGVCRQAALTQRARQLLGTGAASWLRLLEELTFALDGSCLVVPSPAPKVCQELVRALEFLELISVNLLLFPWRKEIRSLKVGTALHLSKGIPGRGGFLLGEEACPAYLFGLILQREKPKAKEVNATCP